MIGIYKITNNINGKIYIGQSVNIDRRIHDHFYRSQDEYCNTYNSPLHFAIRKYGKENFSWEILEECSSEELDELEKKYIKLFNTISPNGYNVLEGGQKNRYNPIYCKRCGELKLTKDGDYCVKCAHFYSRRTEWPEREELKGQIRQKTFEEIAKIYGVSSNAIRKWCDFYNLPRRKRDIKKISDEDWKKI